MSSSEKTKVVIGRDFKDVFEQICDLKEKGFIDDDGRIIESIAPNHQTIVTTSDYGNYEYVLDINLESNEIEMSYEMGRSGASWFKTIRNEEDVDLGSSSWNDFISTIAQNFHKENSFLEYEQSRLTVSKESEESHKINLRKILNTFFNNELNDASITKKDKNTYDEIFSVLLSMGIYSTGEPETVLCRIFFRKVGSKVAPLSSSEARSLDTMINAQVTNGGKNKHQTLSQNVSEDNDTVYLVLSGLENAVDSGSIRDFIIFSGDDDINIIKKIIGPNASANLFCKNIKVLNIVKCKLFSSEYYVTYKNNSIFKAKFDTSGALNLDCARCKENYQLIIHNQIVRSINPDGSIEFVEKPIDFNESNLGFTDEEMKDIKTNTVLKNHAIKIVHEIRRLQKSCIQYRCKQDIIEINLGGKKKENFCRNCIYEEVLYREKDNYQLTRNLLLDHSSLTLMKEEKIDVCPSCGRTFDNSVLASNGGLCPLCSKIESLVDNPSDNNNVYANYRYLLEPFTRAIALLFRKTRVAAEDSQYIVLRVGNKTKIYDKSNVSDKGYLNIEVERPKGNRE